ncbi:extracellular solute-binding protein [Limnothrix sp. FACHB-708]|uniref:ABC transporter substrate-binding protein n=1 Tax=unclassified Limnothrix TaxID=2632864 RepID=UPI001684E1B7|nr:MULTISPECIES: extracellular solute-binding protein [unclassified Limnothrix]MBD2552278.1 extracellular solute-binding protein [Limnothrix sp. FACHB-708]MBD2590145.1 extracellular solute-binding protein [Limnothrix sp. FACHB-406]
MKILNKKDSAILSASITAFFLFFNMVSCHQGKSVPETTPAKNPVDSSKNQQRFDGINITVATMDRPIGVGVERRTREFEKLTGAKVNIVTFPQKEVFPSMQREFLNKTNQYDVVVFSPQWMADFVVPGYLENLTTRVKADSQLQWDDIAPFFRDFTATYQGQIYAVPIDGDFQMIYYRTDILEKAGISPPQTWDDYIAIAKKLHGQDLNADGQADYGSCMAKQPNHVSHQMLWSVVSPFLQSKGTKEGAFFDPETMKPLVNNAAFSKALDIYKETTKYAPPKELTLNLDGARKLFLDGRCAMTVDWGDVGTLAIDPTLSKILDKVGASILPGSKKVLDRKTGKLVACDKFTCPYAIDGVNHAPYGAVGGWVGGINATAQPKVKDAGYALISYISQPTQSNVDVTIGITGFNPYRVSQFTNRETWLKAGMKEAAVSKYLGGISVSLKNPNMVLDLRVPESALYQREILDAALTNFLAGKSNRQETMRKIERKWEEITNQTGRDSQLKAYRASLGIE